MPSGPIEPIKPKVQLNPTKDNLEALRIIRLITNGIYAMLRDFVTIIIFVGPKLTQRLGLIRKEPTFRICPSRF